MSDIQNQNPETTPETPVEATTTPTTPAEGTSRPRHERSGPRGDRKPRRDGMREEEKEFKEELLAIDRVTRVTAGGRQIRFRASIVIGDGKGRVGLGTGKAGEVQVAIEKAIRDAKKNLITFPIVNGTIPHDVSANYKSSSLFIHPAHPGTGIIAGGSVRKIFAVSGVKDVIAKQHGAPNKITNARVTMSALAALKPLHLVTSFSKKNASEETITSEVAPAKKPAAKKAPAKKKAE
ncbi:MAG: 30S ribosomal protein S5 [Candidatus Gracilibacteria bacterium]|nr:30S ribosomal protein S5 [Candidatus Gracilibacteria bacterium]